MWGMPDELYCHARRWWFAPAVAICKQALDLLRHRGGEALDVKGLGMCGESGPH
jgi:hypothetical protein